MVTRLQITKGEMYPKEAEVDWRGERVRGEKKGRKREEKKNLRQKNKIFTTNRDQFTRESVLVVVNRVLEREIER